jgi:hypothetical protein
MCGVGPKGGAGALFDRSSSSATWLPKLPNWQRIRLDVILTNRFFCANFLQDHLVAGMLGLHWWLWGSRKAHHVGGACFLSSEGSERTAVWWVSWSRNIASQAQSISTIQWHSIYLSIWDIATVTLTWSHLFWKSISQSRRADPRLHPTLCGSMRLLCGASSCGSVQERCDTGSTGKMASLKHLHVYSRS